MHRLILIDSPANHNPGIPVVLFTQSRFSKITRLQHPGRKPIRYRRQIDIDTVLPLTSTLRRPENGSSTGAGKVNKSAFKEPPKSGFPARPA